MKTGKKYSVVFVTAPNIDVARSLAKVALEARLVACANLISNVESHYWWQGKLESSNEVLVLFKTTRLKLRVLEKLILQHHPYDTPEIVTTTLDSGNERYLKWISASTQRGRN